jgi:phosphatidylglycerol:prolipoprotein diacylglycerol transferase
MSPFWQWWQHLPSRLDPYLLEFGSFRIGYYGLMYLAAFLTCYLLARYRAKRDGFPYQPAVIQDYVVWAALGLVAGARLGYVVFYNPGYYLAHPLEVVLPFRWDEGFRYTGISGMSYHGGAIGVLASSWLFLRRRGIAFWSFAEFFAPVIPLGYTFGRLGNFINGELYGRATDVSWGMYFPLDPTGLLRHPSQLYEAFFEGLVLFAVLWWARRRSPFEGFLLALYLIGYGTVRFFIEFVREPDTHLGLLAGSLSMGQLLCLAMLAAGGAIILLRARRS